MDLAGTLGGCSGPATGVVDLQSWSGLRADRAHAGEDTSVCLERVATNLDNPLTAIPNRHMANNLASDATRSSRLPTILSRRRRSHRRRRVRGRALCPAPAVATTSGCSRPLVEAASSVSRTKSTYLG